MVTSSQSQKAEAQQGKPHQHDVEKGYQRKVPPFVLLPEDEKPPIPSLGELIDNSLLKGLDLDIDRKRDSLCLSCRREYDLEKSREN